MFRILLLYSMVSSNLAIIKSILGTPTDTSDISKMEQKKIFIHLYHIKFYSQNKGQICLTSFPILTIILCTQDPCQILFSFLSINGLSLLPSQPRSLIFNSTRYSLSQGIPENSLVQFSASLVSFCTFFHILQPDLLEQIPNALTLRLKIS